MRANFPACASDWKDLRSLPSDRAGLYAKVQPLIENPPSGSAPASAQADPAMQLRIRHAAMMAMASVRGQEAQTFKALVRFIGSGTDRQAVVEALLRIPAGN